MEKRVLVCMGNRQNDPPCELQFTGLVAGVSWLGDTRGKFRQFAGYYGPEWQVPQVSLQVSAIGMRCNKTGLILMLSL